MIDTVKALYPRRSLKRLLKLLGCLIRKKIVTVIKLNNKVIGKLLGNKKLRDRFVVYFSKKIKGEVVEEIDRKFFGLVEKWKRELEDKTYDGFKEISLKIEEDPKFKLP